MAEVTVNGKQVHTLWCSPFVLDIGEYLTSGENRLEVAVTSTWYNRLVYDASLPENERRTWTINGPAAGSELKDSGLTGPVTLTFR